jgi:hypothetical protein
MCIIITIQERRQVVHLQGSQAGGELQELRPWEGTEMSSHPRSRLVILWVANKGALSGVLVRWSLWICT